MKDRLLSWKILLRSIGVGILGGVVASFLATFFNFLIVIPIALIVGYLNNFPRISVSTNFKARALASISTIIIAFALILAYPPCVFCSSPIFSACAATPYSICSNLVYSHATGNIIVTIGQNSYFTFYNANVAFVPQNASDQFRTGVACQLKPFPITSNIPYNSIGTINPGNKISIMLPVTKFANSSCALPLYLGPQTVGTPLAGTIWVSYTSSQTSTNVNYIQIATVITKTQ